MNYSKQEVMQFIQEEDVKFLAVFVNIRRKAAPQ